MKRVMVIIVFLAIVGIAVIGYQHGWYRVSEESGDGKTTIDITVDHEKAKKEAEELERKAKEKANELGDKVPKKRVEP